MWCLQQVVDLLVAPFFLVHISIVHVLYMYDTCITQKSKPEVYTTWDSNQLEWVWSHWYWLCYIDINDPEESVTPFKAINRDRHSPTVRITHSNQTTAYTCLGLCWIQKMRVLVVVNTGSGLQGFVRNVSEWMNSYYATTVLVRRYEPVSLSDGTKITNKVDCPLLKHTESIRQFQPYRATRPVSVVHECSDQEHMKGRSVHLEFIKKIR